MIYSTDVQTSESHKQDTFPQCPLDRSMLSVHVMRNTIILYFSSSDSSYRPSSVFFIAWLYHQNLEAGYTGPCKLNNLQYNYLDLYNILVDLITTAHTIFNLLQAIICHGCRSFVNPLETDTSLLMTMASHLLMTLNLL